MKSRRGLFSFLTAGMGMLALIFDSRTALTGAAEGISLCLNTVVPALFPFLVLSIVLTGQLHTVRARWLRPLGRLLRLPENGEKLLLIGLFGGYPVGAQCVCDAYDAGALSQNDAHRLLRFCNNAGPAFIFGIGAHLLGSIWACWLAWGIHIISALAVGYVTPADEKSASTAVDAVAVSWTEAVRRAIRVMAMICGWVVLFRIILAFLDRWLFWAIPENISVFLSGLIELTNGCSRIGQVAPFEWKFVMFVTMLSFGGLCVGLQTKAVVSASGLSVKPYFLGKTAQCALSSILSGFMVPLLPACSNGLLGQWMVLPSLIFVAYIISCRCDKKRIAFRKKIVYTGVNSTGGRTYEAF